MTDKGIELIKEFEGFEPNAYWDASGKVWTIGYGATFYMDETPVKKGDTITVEEATVLLERMVEEEFEVYVDQYAESDINPYQRDALTSFTYNVGPANLKRSTLLKKVNENPNDPTIRNEFTKWNKSGGKVLNGLTKRRKAEADLYFTEYERPSTHTAEEKKNSEPPVVTESAAKDNGNIQNATVEKTQKSLIERIIEWLASIFS